MSLYEVFLRKGASQLPHSRHPISTTGRNNGVTTLYIIVEKPMSKAQNANLFRDPKIFYATPFGVATHSLRNLL